MSVSIKSEKELAVMREACSLLAQLLEELKSLILPGVTTA